MIYADIAGREGARVLVQKTAELTYSPKRMSGKVSNKKQLEIDSRELFTDAVRTLRQMGGTQRRQATKSKAKNRLVEMVSPHLRDFAQEGLRKDILRHLAYQGAKQGKTLNFDDFALVGVQKNTGKTIEWTYRLGSQVFSGTESIEISRIDKRHRGKRSLEISGIDGK